MRGVRNFHLQNKKKDKGCLKVTFSLMSSRGRTGDGRMDVDVSEKLKLPELSWRSLPAAWPSRRRKRCRPPAPDQNKHRGVMVCVRRRRDSTHKTIPLPRQAQASAHFHPARSPARPKKPQTSIPITSCMQQPQPVSRQNIHWYSRSMLSTGI